MTVQGLWRNTQHHKAFVADEHSVRGPHILPEYCTGDTAPLWFYQDTLPQTTRAFSSPFLCFASSLHPPSSLYKSSRSAGISMKALCSWLCVTEMTSQQTEGMRWGWVGCRWNVKHTHTLPVRSVSHSHTVGEVGLQRTWEQRWMYRRMDGSALAYWERAECVLYSAQTPAETHRWWREMKARRKNRDIFTLQLLSYSYIWKASSSGDITQPLQLHWRVSAPRQK